MTTDEAIALIERMTISPLAAKRSTDLRRALDMLSLAGAHPITLDEIWRISAWTSGMDRQRSLTWHLTQLREQLGY